MLSATAFELLPVEVDTMQFRKNLVKNFIRLTFHFMRRNLFFGDGEVGLCFYVTDTFMPLSSIWYCVSDYSYLMLRVYLRISFSYYY